MMEGEIWERTDKDHGKTKTVVAHLTGGPSLISYRHDICI
jgi:hypothetical protein